jgi:hypothetical protein
MKPLTIVKHPILTLNPKVPTVSQNCGLFLALRARASKQERRPQQLQHQARAEAAAANLRSKALFEAWWKSVTSSAAKVVHAARERMDE